MIGLDPDQPSRLEHTLQCGERGGPTAGDRLRADSLVGHDEIAHVLRIELAREPRRAHEVGEQNSEVPALLVRRRLLGHGKRERGAAFPAEALAGLALRPADRARERERPAAADAESHSLAILVPAA